jgi:hypothetical protein
MDTPSNAAPAPAPTPKRQIHWTLELVLAAAALGTAYLSASLAIDTGKLQYYVLLVIFFGLTVRHTVQTFQAWRRR